MIRSNRVHQFIVACAVAIAAPVCAESATAPEGARPDHFAERQAKQMERIERGEKDGRFTAQQAARLREQEQRLAEMHTKMTADGKFTPEERRQMRHAMERQSRLIAGKPVDRPGFHGEGKADRPQRERNPQAGGGDQPGSGPRAGTGGRPDGENAAPRGRRGVAG